MVQWESPATTGCNGVTISEYAVTVDGGVTLTVSHDGSGGVFTATITGLEYNTSYSVSVTAINTCGLCSQPATTTVFIAQGVSDGLYDVYHTSSFGRRRFACVKHFELTRNTHSFFVTF